jgi:hypothetical protein
MKEHDGVASASDLIVEVRVADSDHHDMPPPTTIT